MSREEEAELRRRFREFSETGLEELRALLGSEQATFAGLTRALDVAARHGLGGRTNCTISDAEVFGIVGEVAQRFISKKDYPKFRAELEARLKDR